MAQETLAKLGDVLSAAKADFEEFKETLGAWAECVSALLAQEDLSSAPLLLATLADLDRCAHDCLGFY